MLDFSNRSIVILGASKASSMGGVLAKKLSAAGAKVLVAARDEHNLTAFAQSIGAHSCICDIAAEQQVAKLANQAAKHFDGLDFAVNMSGQALMGDIHNTSEATFRQAVDVHLLGVFFFFKHMARVIKSNGAMITASSITASRVINNHAAYMAAKAGADHLMKIAALEYGSRGIRVNSVAPGFTGDTPMTEEAMKLTGLQELFEKNIPLGRLNTAADVAHTVSWLLHPESFITGQVIQVNGGNSLTGMPSRDDFRQLIRQQDE